MTQTTATTNEPVVWTSVDSASAPERSHSDYDAMLADPDVEAVVIAVSDPFPRHQPLG
jgi:predicted dehydrogenase